MSRRIRGNCGWILCHQLHVYFTHSMKETSEFESFSLDQLQASVRLFSFNRMETYLTTKRLTQVEAWKWIVSPIRIKEKFKIELLNGKSKKSVSAYVTKKVSAIFCGNRVIPWWCNIGNRYISRKILKIKFLFSFMNRGFPKIRWENGCIREICSK